MRQYRIFLFSAFFLLITAQAMAAENPWQLRKDEDGIRVSTRKVDGSPILEFKSEMTVDTPQDKVVHFYEQVNRYPEWFYQCSAARVLEEKPGGEQIIYYAMHMPWPVSNRDSVYKRTRSTGPGGDVIVKLSAEPDAYPKQPGKVRVPYLKTEWHFKPLPAGRTEIAFQQHCDSGGHLPAALVNSLSVNMPFKTFQKMRELLKK